MVRLPFGWRIGRRGATAADAAAAMERAMQAAQGLENARQRSEEAVKHPSRYAFDETLASGGSPLAGVVSALQAHVDETEHQQRQRDMNQLGWGDWTNRQQERQR